LFTIPVVRAVSESGRARLFAGGGHHRHREHSSLPVRRAFVKGKPIGPQENSNQVHK
jgi:hypothetical protein